ncbi:phage minor capsid protein [Priestia sp. FSL R5-0597]|uniref:phage minor capsid protein n=1 Tax=Priestia sp. FSL R5-0597 TaxID=2921580 RepID=UPI0030FB8859
MNSEQLIEYFAKVIQTIMNRIGGASNLTEDKNAQNLITAILKDLDTLGIKSNEVMPMELQKVYNKSLDIASKELKDMGVTPPPIKKKIHMAAVKQIIFKTMDDIRKSVARAKNNAKTMVNRVVSRTKSEIAKGLILGNHSKIVKKRVAKMFQEEGITGFATKDKNGRDVTIRIEKYAETVVRTKMRDANTQGAVNRYVESGVTLVQVSKHSPSCAKCGRFAGMVICLDGSNKGFKSIKDEGIELPPFHPNCRHTVKSWVKDYKTQEEIEEEKNKWQNWREDVDKRTPAQQRAYKKEQDIRKKANDELKQFERYKSLLGNDMFKTIGAFRRAKRTNSKSWQLMQQKYRQANRELKAQ